MTSKIPAIVGQHLDAIHCIADNKIVLGSSDLTGRYWNGSLWCFQTPDDSLNVENCLAAIEVSSGICDLAVYDKDKIAVGLDSGGLEFYSISSEQFNFTLLFGAYEHDDFITSLDLTSDQSNLVTTGADKCVKIWNLESWATTHTFRPVHAGTIWQVSCCPEDPQTFLTCGQDGKIMLFDCRLPKPVTVIDANPLNGEITSICWQPSSTSSFVAGDEKGLLVVKDLKNNQTLSSWQPHKRRIFKISFSESKHLLASCADDTYVCVSNLASEPEIIYTDDRHDDFIRGLAWNSKEELLSCGWDKKILTHIVDKPNQM